MHDVGAAHGFEQLAGHVIGRAGARGGVVEVAGLGLQQRQELLQVLGRHRGVHHHQQVGVVDGRHRHEIAHELVGAVRQQRLVDGVRVRHHQQRVAVGRRLGDLARADQRAGAGPVLDDERLLERFLQVLADDAGVDVGGPAGAERHDDLDGPRWVVLRRGRAQAVRQPQQRERPPSRLATCVSSQLLFECFADDRLNAATGIPDRAQSSRPCTRERQERSCVEEIAGAAGAITALAPCT